MMPSSAVPQDDLAGSQRTDASADTGNAQPPSSFKASSLNASGTTPRLLFTWDPYGRGASTSRQPDPLEASHNDVPHPTSGEDCSTPSSANHNSNAANDTGGPTVQPPLTISSLLMSMPDGAPPTTTTGSGSGTRSPQLSANAAVHTPHQQPSAEAASTHSTPSGPVLKRISTAAKDGRQYFLDYSPTTAANANPVAGMPNLMLPPNLSPHSRGVSPLNPALPPQQRTRQQTSPSQPAEADATEADHRVGSATTSPHAVPLVSPPRSSSIGGVVGPGPYAYSSLANHPSGSYGVYGTSPQQKPQSSSLLGNSMNSGLLSASVGSAGGGVTQHNPYRTSPTFYPVPATGVVSPAVVQRVQAADTDADLYEVLETTPSLFIKRLLPPPPPLPDVARVLPTPGVVQTLCERWCSIVEAVLRSREFSDVVTPPPPPPPVPSPTAPSPTTADSAGAEAKGSSDYDGSTAEELRAWYAAALEWYDQLDQAGAATVDIRAASRTVAWAIDVAASGRGRRNGGPGPNGVNGRYHSGSAGGGRGSCTSGYRGGAYGGYAGGHSYGSRGTGGATGGYRGGRGGGGSNFYTGANGPSPRVAVNEMEGTANSSGNTRNAFYPSNFNPYAESWTFSGDTQLSAEAARLPPPPMPSKPSCLSKVPTAGQQEYAASTAKEPM